MESSRGWKGLNTNQLKYIAVIGMVLDSLYFAFPNLFPVEFRLLSRYVAPLFAFFVAEGYALSRDRPKYMKRLWTAAILMEIGRYFVFLAFGAQNQIRDNIILTFALSVTIIWLIEKTTKDNASVLYLVAAITILIICYRLGYKYVYVQDYIVWVEGGILIPNCVLIFYFLRDNRKTMLEVLLLYNVLYILIFYRVGLPQSFSSISDWWYAFCRRSDPFVFLVIPFILLYNGKKGSMSKFHRYFFYIFYPGHLLVLYSVAILLGFR